MNALITKKDKKRIMILGWITGVLGATAGSIGLYLRTEFTTSESWDAPGLPQFTNGYFGVTSGFLLFLLGTAGFGLVYSRIFCLVILYEFFSLMCDVLCILDVTMVFPYTKNNGRFAWDKQGCNSTDFETFQNSTNLRDIDTETCDNIKTIAILFICIPTAVLITLVFSTVATIVTGVALRRAQEDQAPSDQPGVELSPFESLDYFHPTSYNNIMSENGGFKP